VGPDAAGGRIAGLCERCDEHGLDGVQPVLGLVEDDAGGRAEDVVGDLDDVVGRAQLGGRAASTSSWPEPRYSIASNMRSSTRAVSATDSLWPICEPVASR